MAHANVVTGSSGLIAADKVGNQVLFLDRVSYETVLTLDGSTCASTRCWSHPMGGTAYVPIYVDGWRWQDFLWRISRLRSPVGTPPRRRDAEQAEMLGSRRYAARRSSPRRPPSTIRPAATTRPLARDSAPGRNSRPRKRSRSTGPGIASPATGACVKAKRT